MCSGKKLKNITKIVAFSLINWNFVCFSCFSWCVYGSVVITGTVITAAMRGGSMYATVSIINVYKEGSLAIQQAGKTMSTKIIILCKKCPFIRRGGCRPLWNFFFVACTIKKSHYVNEESHDAAPGWLLWITDSEFAFSWSSRGIGWVAELTVQTVN